MKKDELVQVVREAVQEAVESLSCRGCCSSEVCREKCGLTPVEHAEDHRAVKRWRGFVERSNQSIRQTVIRAVVGFMIVCFGTGFVFMVWQWLLKVAEMKAKGQTP